MKVEELTINIGIENEEEIKAKLTGIRQQIDDITQAAKRLNNVIDEINGAHGYWKLNRRLRAPECSVCEVRPSYMLSMYDVNKTYKYCPNCGAKMDRKESGDDKT